MNRLRNFMSGRYGTDQLNLALLIFYLLCCILYSITKLYFFNVLALIAVILCFYRMLSRDISRRASENQRFLTQMQPFFSWCRRIKMRTQDKQHRYYRCPCCKQTLRVPRGRGKITITCPRCRTTLTKKT